jgi:PAS domain S-box-containing protein
LIVAGTGEIVFVNDHAGDLFGFELADLLGRVIDDLLPERVRAVHRAHRNRFRAAQPLAGNALASIAPAGLERYERVRRSPLHGRPAVHWSALLRAMTCSTSQGAPQTLGMPEETATTDVMG